MAITVQKLRRVGLYDKWAAAGGVRQAVIPDVAALNAVSNLDGSDRLTLSLPLLSPAAASVKPGAVIRVDEVDSRTNYAVRSRNPNLGPWTGTSAAAMNQVGMDGQPNTAATLTDADAANFVSVQEVINIPAGSTVAGIAFWILRDTDQTRFPQPTLNFVTGTAGQRRVSLNTATGDWVGANTTGAGLNGWTDVHLEFWGGRAWWKVSIFMPADATNTQITARVYPAARSALGSGELPAVTGSIVFGNLNAEFNVARIGDPIFTDAATVTLDAVYDEWKVVEGPTDNDETGLRTVAAAPLAATDLVGADLVRRIDADGTVVMDFESVGLTPLQQITQWVLPALVRGGLPWVTAGNITPTQLIDLAFQWDTPLAVLQRIADQTQTELDIRRVGAGYVIDLVPAIASAASVPDLRFDKNLQPGSEKVPSSIDQTTRVFPRGAQEDEGYATMARAVWKVTNIAGLVVTLADPSGGVGPIQFDGQLAGLNGTTQAYLRKTDGTLTIVNASSVAAQTVTVASVASVAIGDLIQFRADAAGTDLISLDSPPDWLNYGLKAGTVDVSDAPSTNNLLKNGAMRSWPGPGTSPPTNWIKLGGGTVAQNAAAPFTKVGGFSIHRVGAADGDGLISDAVAIFPTQQNPYVSSYAGVWVVSGQVRVELVFTTPTGIIVQPVLPDVASNSVLGQFDDLGVDGIDAFSIGATAVQLRVVQHGATVADFYVDYAQATQSAAQLPFTEGSGGTRLWQAANEKLRTNGAPLVSYSIPIVDLAALDPITWSADKMVVGGTVRVTDPRLSIAVLARLIELERDYKVPGNTKITLSNKPDEITSAGGNRPARRSPSATATDQAGDPAVSLNDLRVTGETVPDATHPQGTLTYSWIAGALVSRVVVGQLTFANPLPADPWAAVRTAIMPLPQGTSSITVNKPAEGSVLYVQLETRLSDLTVGEVRRLVVNPAPTQLPSIELDDSESSTTGTQFWKITERGLSVLTVDVQTQIGSEPVSAFGPPTRGPGSPSVVRGGILGVGEYEHDVILDATRFAWIMPRLTLSNGALKTLGPFGFDRDKRPNILSVILTGTKLVIMCDSDTKSIKVTNSGGTWIYQGDGLSLTADVAQTGTNGGTGLGAAATDTYTITAQSDPLAYVDVNTLLESRNQVIGGLSAPPATATWDSPGVSVAAPATNGSDVAKITLKATSAPVGWTVSVYILTSFNSSGTPTVDHTADLTPALSAPPAVSTDYSYSTGFTKSAHTAGTGLVTMKVRADLKNGSGTVIDSRTVQATWYSPV